MSLRSVLRLSGMLRGGIAQKLIYEAMYHGMYGCCRLVDDKGNGRNLGSRWRAK